MLIMTKSWKLICFFLLSSVTVQGFLFLFFTFILVSLLLIFFFFLFFFFFFSWYVSAILESSFGFIVYLKPSFWIWLYCCQFEHRHSFWIWLYCCQFERRNFKHRLFESIWGMIFLHLSTWSLCSIRWLFSNFYIGILVFLRWSMCFGSEFYVKKKLCFIVKKK
jgi:hypothetical protein